MHHGQFVWADAMAMHMVIRNLLSNALKFTIAGGAIEIACHKQGPKAVLSIKDNGVGMDQEKLSHVFEKFSQAERSGGASGFGLGLFLCKQLIEAQNGTISCTSDTTSGKSFEIVLPLTSQQSIRALIIEHNPDYRATLARHLQTLLIQSTSVGSGMEAISAIAKNSYEAIFMDIQMPGFDGLRTAQAMRAIGLEVPILVYTTDAERDPKDFHNAGINGVLKKPSDLDGVKSAIERCVQPYLAVVLEGD